jgi:regulator of sigma E protease
MNTFSILTIVWTFLVSFFLFSLTVIAHEFGHFIAARKKGLIVERFAIGFGPKILSWKKNGVEYVINLLPFGGFVQLPQMAAMDMVEGKSEFDSQKLPPASSWAKIVTAFWGPLFSFLFAFILSFLVWCLGVPQNQNFQTTTIGFVEPGSPAETAGLKPGDKILSIDGQHVERWAGRAGGVVEAILLSVNKKVMIDVERGTQELITFEITPKQNPNMENLRYLGFEKYFARDLVVDRILENSPAEKAGLQKGDQILSINGEKMYSPFQISEYIRKSSGPIEFLVLRKGQQMNISITPVKADNHDSLMIGVMWTTDSIKIVHLNPFEQITNSLTFIYKTLRAVSSRESNVGLRHLSGPIGIFDKLMTLLTTDVRMVLYFTVILNINLAVLNLLPIPILDGGHILFSIVEALRKRPLESKIMYAIQMSFFCILIGFFIFVTFHDVWRIGRRVKESSEKENYELPKFESKAEKP